MNIRASMLPGYPDCPRRAAAKQFRQMIEVAGFQLRQLMTSIGSSIGTAVHAVAEHLLRVKIETGKPGKVQDGLDKAMTGFDEEIGQGCEWDDTTANRDAAQQQIQRMGRAYLQVAKAVDPLAVELEMKGDLLDGFTLTGHIDLLTRDGWVRDTKTGALIRPYFAQLGGYGMLARTAELCGCEGFEPHQLPEIQGLATDFIKRCPKTKPQEPAVETVYPLVACQQVAWQTILRIKADVLAFQQEPDPGKFLCNPMSMMCTPRYCPAHGTDFCELTKGG